MAVFWKNIKGMAEDDGSHTIYTYIDFINTENGTELGIRRGNEEIGKIALAGKNCETPQTINKIISKQIGATADEKQTIQFAQDAITVNPATTFKAKITAEEVNINNNLSVTKEIKANNAVITGECQAGFFNATSDKRAKENFKLLSTEAALKTVIDTPLYSFDYKSGAHSIGVLAQDLIHVDMNNFSFVGNQKASGQNGDYMNVHESKLIYLLWAAIQEQQKEIESLRAQLKQFLRGKLFSQVVEHPSPYL